MNKAQLSLLLHALLVFLAAFLGQLALLTNSAGTAAYTAAIPAALTYGLLQLAKGTS